MTIRPLSILDVDQASRLIEQVSDQYTREDFSDLGYQNFKQKVLDNGMRRNLEEGFLYWGGFEGANLIGLITIKPPSHLFNLFVHQDLHNKGIARRLWEHMLMRLKPSSVTVFSSRHAVALYLKLGFQHSGEKISNDEIVCYPMLWKNNFASEEK